MQRSLSIMREALRRMPRNVIRKVPKPTGPARSASTPTSDVEHTVLPMRRHTLTEGEIQSLSSPVYGKQMQYLMGEETRINSASRVNRAIRELKEEVDMTRMIMTARANDDEIVEVSALKAEVERTRSKMMSVGSSARVVMSLNAWQNRAHASAMARMHEV